MPDPVTGRSPNRVESFRYAFSGLRYALRTQPNIWIHSAFTVGVVIVGLWLELSVSEWVSVVLVTGLVWVAELFNTALEAAIDLISPEFHPLAKIGKDVSAAAVLFSAGTAVVVGVLILGPPLFARLQEWFF